MKTAHALTMAACLLVPLTACSGDDPLYGDIGDTEIGNERPEVVEAPPPPVEPAPEPDPVWTCSYDPTYDEDWHNDVVCTNGIDVDRPYLREWDDFVTEDEIMESAREYENALNAG